ncbi:MAG: protein kinase [Proteobacteria bacterium]|nr:protein kinase [Pseudomonadota bacterium]
MDVVGANIAERFRIERRARGGGMGAIYEGRDLETGGLVCIKLLRRPADHRHTARFWQEARTLASLDHPSIVNYRAHGFTETGQPYLVMEWLHGEALDQRLERSALTVEETIAVGSQVARALAAAHHIRLIHRDIKPSNLFLCGGDIARLKVLDFGLAGPVGSRSVGSTAELAGTPGFIAPEQASGDAAIDRRADIYSLGAVLFACLTQRPPYIGQHMMAIIAKLMFAEVPHVREVRPDVPHALDELVTEMLARRPADRPGDAGAVAARLAAMARDTDAVTHRRSVAVSTGEQRFLSVLLVVHDGSRDAELAELAEKCHIELASLSEGTSVAVFSASLEPLEAATRAARFALAVRASIGNINAVLASGRGIVVPEGEPDRCPDASARPHGDRLRPRVRVPVGQVIDRAVALLMGGDVPTVSDIDTQSDAENGHSMEIVMDNVSAGLLASRFIIDETGESRWQLIAENPRPLVVRNLLGRPTECVGRDRELAALEAIYGECIDECAPRVVLVSGPAGAGKSRLGVEFLHRLDGCERVPRVWIARGDSMRSGAPLGLLGQAIRNAMGIADSQTSAERQQRIRTRVASCVAAEQTERVSEFLGEIVGCPFSSQGRIKLQAARDDARLMHDQMLRAWEDWLAGETARHPVLLVLEDLHWGDLPTVRFVDAALRTLSDRPFMVLALARSEIHDSFQNLWEARNIEEFPLRPLACRAAANLARQALGDELDAGQIEQLVTQAQGNPYYLEELIRQVAAGHSDELPETVLTMVQSRLARLPHKARRLLRAASIFGGSFWTGGIVALVGDAAQDVPALLDELVAHEFIVPHRHTRFARQIEYEFCHALTREAAYRSLTEEDRERGHLCAGEWLIDAGESEPIVLAEHFQRGGELARSIEWYRCAAEDSLEASDITAVIERAEQAINCGAEGVTLGALRLLQAEAHNWDGAAEPALLCSREAMHYQIEGSSAWANAVHHCTWAAASLGTFDDVERLAESLATHTGASPTPLYMAAMARCVVHLLAGGRLDRAWALSSTIDRLLPAVDQTPALTATIAHMRGWLAVLDHRLDDACEHMLQAVEYWNRAGNERSACLDGHNVGNILAGLGAYEQAEVTLGMVFEASERLGLDQMGGMIEGLLAIVLARNGALDEAERHMKRALAARQVPRTRGVNRVYWAQILLLAGRPGEALEQCNQAINELKDFASYRALAHAVSGQAQLALGRADQARVVAQRGHDLLNELGELEEGTALVLLVHAEALHATGDSNGARRTILAAKEHLTREAEHLGDPIRRWGFLRDVPEHRRILMLARRWASTDTDA